jgi:2-polyprenyl-6-methoxyphenol hydroxylase-like FAD-dependent oxidoreductase
MAVSNGTPKTTGVRVIIVGAGFAGLTAAIECNRKGHTPIVLEKFPELKILGDIISFGPNSGRIFRRWPGVEERLDPINHKSPGLHYKSYLGEDLFTQTWEKEESFGKKFNGNRGQIHEIVFNYAVERGIDIRLGQSITDYFESDTEAGVISNSERIVGDVVLAADGVRSKGRKIVLGYDDKPKSSGYAIYRAWFGSENLAKNPLTADLVNNGDTHSAWLGPDIHFLSASIKDGKEFSWVCTHKVRLQPSLKWCMTNSSSIRTREISKNPGQLLVSSPTPSASSMAGTPSFMPLFLPRLLNTSSIGSSYTATPFPLGSLQRPESPSSVTLLTPSSPRPSKGPLKQWKTEPR